MYPCMHHMNVYPCTPPCIPVYTDTTHTQDTRDDSPAQTIVGSTPYIAPEMMFPPYDALVCGVQYHTCPPTHNHIPPHPTITHTPHPPTPPQKADLWCAGVFLYWMVCGQPPFGEIPNFARIGPVKYPGNVVVTADLDDLLKKLLVKVPEERLTLEQLKQHPWFVRGLPPRAFDSNVPSKPIPPEVCCSSSLACCGVCIWVRAWCHQGVWFCRKCILVHRKNGAHIYMHTHVHTCIFTSIHCTHVGEFASGGTCCTSWTSKHIKNILGVHGMDDNRM